MRFRLKALMFLISSFAVLPGIGCGLFHIFGNRGD